MSSLISDLNQIYEIKGQIKEVANIESDVFSEYPGYIAAAIASGGATGTIEIDENGTHNVATYEYAYVNVPQQEVPVVPPGYTYVYGSYDVLENGNDIDISSYAYINVNVPAPEGWLYPSGYAYITTNGEFNIREFEGVTVAVPEGGITPEGTSYITVNGVYDIGTYSYVDVNVPQGGITPTGYAYIIANGDYNITSYAMVNVNVPQGGGGDEYAWVDPASYTMVVGEKYAFNGTLSGTAQGQITSELIAMYPALEPYLNWYIYSISGADKTGDTEHLWSKIAVIENPGGLAGQPIVTKGTWSEPITGTLLFIVDELYAAKYAGGNGTRNITSNGITSVNQYSYVNVNVAPTWNWWTNDFLASPSTSGITYSYQLNKYLNLGPDKCGIMVGSGSNTYMAAFDISDINDAFTDISSIISTYNGDAYFRVNIDDTSSTYITSDISADNSSSNTVNMNFTNLWDSNIATIDDASITCSGNININNANFINNSSSVIVWEGDADKTLRIENCDFSNLTTTPIVIDLGEGASVICNGCTWPPATVQYIINGTIRGEYHYIEIDGEYIENFPVVNPNYSSSHPDYNDYNDGGGEW